MAHQYRSCPAAGRSFMLGMLYDCRSDTLIKGLTLWDNATLEKYIRTTSIAGSSFNITCDDSFDKKARSVGIKGDLKLSLLAGLIEGGSGSAKFLHDRVKTTNQARVVMNYSCTTQSVQLSMEHLALDKIMHPQQLTSGIATHVVVGIDYGADAHFVFDSATTSKDAKQQLSGSLEAKLTVHTAATVSGQLSAHWDKTEEALAKRFQCKFYGDFNLPKNPTTVESALETCAQLPTLLGPNKEHAVPKTVYLLPLTFLDDKAAKFVREVNNALVVRCISVCEAILKHEAAANEILFSASHMEEKISTFERKIHNFVGYLDQYHLQLTKQIAAALPKIRGGETSETALNVILDKHALSAFNSNECEIWIRQLRKDVRVLHDWISELNRFPFEQYDDVCAMRSTDYVVCLMITVKDEDEFLSRLRTILDTGCVVTHIPTQHTEWNAGSMRQQIDKFASFAIANQHRSNVKFIVVENESHSPHLAGLHIALYHNYEFETIELPTEPRLLTAVDATQNSITLSWQPPEFGIKSAQSYEVRYRKTGADQKLTKTVNEAVVTIADLEPDTSYMLTVGCVAAYGASDDSNICQTATKKLDNVIYGASDSLKRVETASQQIEESQQPAVQSGTWYVVGGNSKNFFAYDVCHRTWKVLLDLPWQRTGNACSVGKRLISIGESENRMEWTKYFDEYDIFTSKWTTSTTELNNHIEQYENSTVCADEKSVYAIGGNEEGGFGRGMEKYDGSSCRVLAEMSNSKAYPAAVYAQNCNGIFVAGGCDEECVIEKYSISCNNWTIAGKLVNAFNSFFFSTTAALLGDELYLVQSSSRLSATANTFNIRTGQIRKNPELFTPRKGCRAIELDNNVVCVLGGSDKKSSSLASVEALDIREGKWTTGLVVRDMPCGVSHFGLAKV